VNRPQAHTVRVQHLAEICGYLSVRFAVRYQYLRARNLTPFAVSSLVLGLGSIVCLELSGSGVRGESRQAADDPLPRTWPRPSSFLVACR
jgi:hypothetical protein